MSTKTSFKRVALVAVAALGMGVLTSVSPAIAASTSTGSQNAYTVRSDDATYASQPGDSNATTAAITVTEGGGAGANGDFLRVTYKATATSTPIKLTTANIANGAVTALTGGVTLTLTAVTSGAIGYTASTEALASNSGAAGTIVLKVGRAAIPGIYTLMYDDANTFATTADTNNFSKSITVTGAPSAISVVGTGTTNTNTVVAGDGTSSYTVSVSDSAGNSTYLLSTERLNLTENGTGLSVTTPGLAVITNAELGSTQSTKSTTVTLTTASLAAGTYTLTVTPVNLPGVAAATGSLVYTSITARVVAASIVLTAPTTQLSGSATAIATLPTASTVSTATATGEKAVYSNLGNSSFTFRIKAAADATGFVQYTVASSGVTTSPAAGTYTAVLTADATASYADVTVTTSSIATNGYFSVQAWEDANEGVSGSEDYNPKVTVTYKVPVISKVSFTNPDASSIAVKIGATTDLIATAKDQYGNTMSNQNVYFNVAASGRTTAVEYARVTDALGTAKLTLTDTSTSTTALADTIKVDTTSGSDGSGDLLDSIAFAYAADISATAMTSVAYKDSSGTYSGAILADGTTEVTIDNANGSTTYSDQIYMAATLKNAAGAVVEGLPVVFTVTGGFLASETDTSAAQVTVGTLGVTTVTVYTDSNGVARAAVAVTKSGTVKVTATSGTLTKSHSVTAITSAAAAAARNIAVAIKNELVTATVTDGYGNGVSGVSVTLAASGGSFQTGSNTVTATTDASGKATASLTSGTAITVKASIAAGTYTQSDDVAATPVDSFTAGSSSATATAASVVASDISALTLLINTLVKKLNALATLVAKIQKKLGVK